MYLRFFNEKISKHGQRNKTRKNWVHAIKKHGFWERKNIYFNSKQVADVKDRDLGYQSTYIKCNNWQNFNVKDLDLNYQFNINLIKYLHVSSISTLAIDTNILKKCFDSVIELILWLSRHELDSLCWVVVSLRSGKYDRIYGIKIYFVIISCLMVKFG